MTSKKGARLGRTMYQLGPCWVPLPMCTAERRGAWYEAPSPGLLGCMIRPTQPKVCGDPHVITKLGLARPPTGCVGDALHQQVAL